jgi:predicted MFS family arabinose efflux permease
MDKEAVKYKLIYFIRYFGDALFSPFFAMYFVAKGLSAENLGIVLAISPITTLLANPFWSYVVKDLKTSRRVLKIMTLVQGILVIALTRISGFELIALVVALFAFFTSPYAGVLDGFTASFTHKNHLEYGPIRIYASIGYVIALSGAGYLIVYLGYDILFVTAGAFFLLASLLTFALRPTDQGETGVAPKTERNIKALFQNRNYLKFLLFYTLMMGSFLIGETFVGVYMTADRGLSIVGYGWVFCGFVFVEVLAMQYLNVHGSHFDEKKMFLVASLLFAIRYLAYAFSLPLPLLIAFSMLRGISAGIVIYAFIKYVVLVAGLSNVTAAILFISLSCSLFSGLGNFFAGEFLARFGFAHFYLLIAGLVLCGVLALAFLMPKAGTLPPNPEPRRETGE